MYINKKQICCLIPSLSIGGMERVMSELINYFSGLPDVEVHLFLYGNGYTPNISFQIDENVIIHKPNFIFDKDARLLSTLKTMKWLRKQIYNNRYFYFLSFGEIWNNLVLLSSLGIKKNIYVSDRCSPLESFGFVQNKLRRILYPHTKGIVAQTNKAKNIYLKELKNANIVVIPNPIRRIQDTQNIVKENWVITIGRLIPTKNHLWLIELFSDINNPDWKLIIVGGDELNIRMFSILENKINELNLNNRVVLLGKRKFLQYIFVFIGVTLLSYIAYDFFQSNDDLTYRMRLIDDGNWSGRGIIYKRIFDKWYNTESIINFIFGFGFTASFTLSNGQYAHNDWLEVLSNFGLLGVFIYFSFFFAILRLIVTARWDIKKKILLSTVTVIWLASTLFSMHYASSASVFQSIMLAYVFGNQSKLID